MNRRYARAHMSPEVVLRSAHTNAGRERTSTADLLADLSDIDERKHYLPAAHPSMLAYCMGELHLWEQAALKRIRAARTAGRFPAIFEAVAAGRLHLTAVVMLAPYLTEGTAAELLSAAAHKSKAELERLLAERFPRTDVLTWVAPASSAPAGEQHAPAQVEVSPGTVAPVHEVVRVTPLSTQSYAVQFTMSQSAHEKLRYVQTLLGSRVPSQDIAQVFEQALDAWIPQLEKRRFSATAHPRRGRRVSANSRCVPAGSALPKPDARRNTARTCSTLHWRSASALRSRVSAREALTVSTPWRAQMRGRHQPGAPTPRSGISRSLPGSASPDSAAAAPPFPRR